ncbi:MAG: DNA-directed RNA polymerase subunit delta [Syntrophomonadaceae bacterium]|nr:DNA-directed RNA polymerase subunit delta [Syntrophomonadaceae bacterium]MDD3898100.1 DNA-directed RNA polymerase subunit delta [Syntrophomonadaceae bacterium]MDD4561923.1 DNA-directed RNA polymerase subunit delta [Syntrophomonadaceae bacterium]
MVPRKKSEADWAVEILAEKQEAIYYFDLIETIAKQMGKKNDPPSLTSIYTRLNMDNRLVYQGDGYWYYDASRLKRER